MEGFGGSPPASGTDVAAALRSGRLAVEQYVRACQSHGDEWNEVQLTSRLLRAAYPPVEYCEFNPRQEKKTGADWLWWWIDESTACFGMLVQAKKLRLRPAGWSIDFGYPNRSQGQMTALFRTADTLEVPPVYMLFTGDVGYRNGLTCGQRHVPADCRRCRRASVSVLSALDAHDILTMDEQFHPELIVPDALSRSSPLEDLVDPAAGTALAHDLNLRRVRPDLAHLLEFARHSQDGARQVAKVVLAEVSRNRTGFATTLERPTVSLPTDAVFETTPGDVGHFGVAYFRHILRGLRKTLPQYVADILAGRKPPAEIENLVAGVVVVHI